MKEIVSTLKAPKAIGPYSQAIKAAGFLFVSGQIPLLPTGELVDLTNFDAQVRQVFENLNAIAQEAGLSLDHAVKLTVYLSDFSNFDILNTIMAEYFTEPYPARATVEVSALPKGVGVEVDAVFLI